ncbi:MAG: FMN-binding glutamate synthase family protein [Bdellovibrionaceae bacterium]|nr:FMN-binding glutamate synthase family protein [Pseudobdellovibrionaceae bacterium]
MRRHFRMALMAGVLFYGVMVFVWPPALWSLLIVGPVFALGLHDYFQNKHTILRNFPIVGHFRYLFEEIRPEINQYFVESNTDGTPFSREQRSLVYQRAKRVRDTIPFGTQRDVYEVGYEWVNHSILPQHPHEEEMRVRIGGPDCRQPYLASRLNVSAMSYGALNLRAVQALNLGARQGGFYHNTGEGGLSEYHLRHGGDVVWQIGTGYFGCRTPEGRFSEDMFATRAAHPNVKMIELKLSQGAKPGHGGILPAAKVTAEIAGIRGVPLGQDVISPPGHTAFSTPVEMAQFLGRLRELSQGKPVGFKLCLGQPHEFISLVKAMMKTGIIVDFITVDGGEGGTGAAPVEFSNSVGSPLREALIFVHNTLVGYGLRDRVRVIASGKVVSGFDLVSRMAIGADVCNSARAMMLALGCIQALRCNSNTCPAGITTNDPDLMEGLNVEDKGRRVASFHHETLKSAREIIGAMGLRSPVELRPWHLMRRTGPTEIRHYGDLYEFLKPGVLLDETNLPDSFARAVRSASADHFSAVEEASHDPTGDRTSAA